MTARLVRLAGAILLENAGQFYLLGNTKQPCDWHQAGFETPAEVDALKSAFIPLMPSREVHVEPPYLLVDTVGKSTEALAQILADRFLIRRNGSVSERLWRIVTCESDESGSPEAQQTDASWLVAMPDQIWEIVRDAALKCL
jgi:hypothetical protein